MRTRPLQLPLTSVISADPGFRHLRKCVISRTAVPKYLSIYSIKHYLCVKDVKHPNTYANPFYRWICYLCTLLQEKPSRTPCRFSYSILSWVPKSLPKKSGIVYHFYCKISAKAQVSLGVLFVKRGRVMGRDAGIQSEGFRTDAQSKPILSHPRPITAHILTWPHPAHPIERPIFCVETQSELSLATLTLRFIF